jgi:hypothetical protein
MTLIARVGRTRVLRQVADRPGGGDAPGRRAFLAGQDLHQGGLTSAVPADETDAVAGTDVEGQVGQQKVGADTYVDSANGDHEITLRNS